MSKRLDRVDARAKLPLRRDPYWHRIAEGRYVGFRRMTKGTPGTWLARAFLESRPPKAPGKAPRGPGYVYETLEDFATLPEGERYDAARKAAEAWFAHLDKGGSTEPQSVKAACEAYVGKLRSESGAAAADDAEGRLRRLVYGDPIAKVQMSKLTPRHFADWKNRALTASEPRSDKEERAARGSFNRNATSFRAALNLAFGRRVVASDHAWAEELKPLEDAGNRRTGYLDHNDRRLLVKSASEESQPLFRTLNMLPMRPGEVAALRVDYLKASQRTLEIPTGKTEPRIIPLTDEAVAHFKACAKGKLPGAWLVSRADGSQWKKEAWRDEIKDAAHKAKLPRATVAYTIRHSVITDLVVGGLDLFTVATIAGTSVVMIQKHYGHLQREHARAALEKLAALA